MNLGSMINLINYNRAIPAKTSAEISDKSYL